MSDRLGGGWQRCGTPRGEAREQEGRSREHSRHVHPDVRVAARRPPRLSRAFFKRDVHDAVAGGEQYAHDVGAVAEVLGAGVVVTALLAESGHNVDAVKIAHGPARLLQAADAVAHVRVTPHGVVP